jgi:hypothetical protein
MKGGEFWDELSDYQLLEKDSTATILYPVIIYNFYVGIRLQYESKPRIMSGI